MPAIRIVIAVTDADRVSVFLLQLSRALESLAEDLAPSAQTMTTSVSQAHEEPSREFRARREPTEGFIDLAETARRLGYSTRWVLARVRDDGLPSCQRIRHGRHKFLWSEVEAWFDLRRHAADLANLTEQSAGGCVERSRYSEDVHEAHIPLAALDPTDVRPMEPGRVGQALLGELELHSTRSNCASESF